MLDHELEVSLNLAISEAARRGHEFVTVEHILYALLHNTSARKAIKSCGGHIRETRKKLDHFFTANLEQATLEEGALPQPTIGFQRVIQRALQQVIQAGKEEINGAHLLVAMYAEPESFATHFLQEQNITRLDIINYIAHGISKIEGDDDTDDTVFAAGKNKLAPVKDEKVDEEAELKTDSDSEAESEEAYSRNDPLALYTVDLNAKAKKGQIDPLIGRQAEIERTIQVLCRRRKNNPLLVGEAGVGKTAIAEGLAQKIVEGNVPEKIKDATIYSLDLAAMLAGSKFRGDFEQRIKALLKRLKKLPKPILFLDEIHTIVGAGAVSGGAMDAANLLKPILAGGELRCIGSTTYKEFRNYFDKDHALARRFQKIDVDEPSREDTLKIIKGLKPQYEQHHGVKYSEDSLQVAVDLAARYITDRKLPDKAIDVLDEAGANLALQPKTKKNTKKVPTVTATNIQAVVAKIAKIPVQKISATDRSNLKSLNADLKKVVFGQDHAIDNISSAITLSRSGLGNEEKPIGSFLFCGPTGVGKTEVARQLARVMGIQFLRYDMSEYMEKHSVSRFIGAPPGYVGFDQGGLLTEAINKNPHCVLLLDEIEKAHPDIQNILLQVMDHGTLTDPNGRKADFRNVVIIMTTNAGARELTSGFIGFERQSKSESTNKEVTQAIKDQFSPEFRGRLDAIVNFNSLSREVVLMIVDKFVNALSIKLLAQDFKLKLTAAARNFIADKGFDPTYGARPLERLIQEQISKPVSEKILFSNVGKGATIHVDVTDKQFAIKFNA